ncbi:MAG: hypothetical protein JO151_16245, partial [Verrucomicrobia bacterium]|nr:hypothetical protein [Verrucomicrobiota bacterium]
MNEREAAGAIVCRLQEDYRDRVELELYFCDDPATAPADQKFPSARQFDLIVCLVDPGARQREGQAEPVALAENEAPFDRLADFALLTKAARNNRAENAGSVAAWQLLTHFLPVAGDRAIDGRDQFTTHIGTYSDVFDFERYLSNTLQQRLRHRYPTEVPREELPNGPAITQPDHFLYRYGYSLNPEIRSYVNNWLGELRRRGRKERRRIALLVLTLTISLTTATALATIWLHRYRKTSDSKTLALRQEHEAERTMRLAIQAGSEAERLLANTRVDDERQIAETRADAARQIARVKDDAEGVLHVIATDLANKLEPVHRLDLLDRSLDSIQNYRASIGRVSEDAPILLWRAGAFSDAADLFRDENRLEEALTAYSSASEILQKLVQRTPADPSWLVRLGTTLRKMGNVLEEQRKPSEAIEHYRRASELFEKALAVKPMDDATRVALDNCLNSVGLLSLRQRDWAQALDYLQRHRNVARNLADHMPKVAARWDNLRVACERLSEIHSSQCAWDSATDTLAEQLIAARHLAELAPDSLDAGRLPAVCLERIARVNENRGAYAEAAASYIEELTSLQLLLDRHHADTSLRRDFCTCLSNLGDVLRVAGNGVQALETHTRAVEQATKLTLADPSNPENKRELALCLKSRASALADLVRSS